MICKPYISIYLFILFFSSGSAAQVQGDSLINEDQSNLEVQFQNKFYEALKQKGIENYSKAIDAFVYCSELFPDRAVIYYQLGTLYFITKSYGRAESNLQKAIELDPNNFWYKEQLYQLYVAQNNFNKAIYALLSLLDKDPIYEEELVNLYVRAGRFEEAIVLIEALDQRYGYNILRDRTRVKIYKQTANQNAHISFLKTRLKEAPENAQNFLNLVYTLSEYNKENEAFSTAKLFLETHPKAHIAHVALYKFYLNAKNYELAIASMKIVTGSNILEPHLKVKVLSDFMQFVQQNPEYKNVLMEVQPAQSLDTSKRSNTDWAKYYQHQNKFEQAVEYYKKSLVDAPDDLQLIKALAKLYLDTNQYASAVEFTLEKTELFPTQIELYLICSQSQLALKKIDDALVTLETGLDYIFEDNELAAKYYLLMANIYKIKNNIKKAQTFSSKAEEIQLKQ